MARHVGVPFVGAGCHGELLLGVVPLLGPFLGVMVGHGGVAWWEVGLVH